MVAPRAKADPPERVERNDIRAARPAIRCHSSVQGCPGIDEHSITVAHPNSGALGKSPSPFADTHLGIHAPGAAISQAEREMDGPIPKKSSHSAAVLIGILLTCLAVVGHQFLPKRRLSL